MSAMAFSGMADSRSPFDPSQQHPAAQLPPQNPVIIKCQGVMDHRLYTKHVPNQTNRYGFGQASDMSIPKGVPVFSYGRCVNMQQNLSIFPEKEFLTEIFAALYAMPKATMIVFEGVSETEYRSDHPNRPAQISVQKSGLCFIPNNGKTTWRPGDQLVARKPTESELKTMKQTVPIIEVAKPTSALVCNRLELMQRLLRRGDLNDEPSGYGQMWGQKVRQAVLDGAAGDQLLAAFKADSQRVVSYVETWEINALGADSFSLDPATDAIQRGYLNLAYLYRTTLARLNGAEQTDLLFQFIVRLSELHDKVGEEQCARSVGMSYGFAAAGHCQGTHVELHRIRHR